MGQYLEFDKSFVKKKIIPKSLSFLEKKGYLKAFFSEAEIKKILRSTGTFINNKSSNYE